MLCGTYQGISVQKPQEIIKYWLHTTLYRLLLHTPRRGSTLLLIPLWVTNHTYIHPYIHAHTPYSFIYVDEPRFVKFLEGWSFSTWTSARIFTLSPLTSPLSSSSSHSSSWVSWLAESVQVEESEASLCLSSACVGTCSVISAPNDSASGSGKETKMDWKTV